MVWPHIRTVKPIYHVISQGQHNDKLDSLYFCICLNPDFLWLQTPQAEKMRITKIFRLLLYHYFWIFCQLCKKSFLQHFRVVNTTWSISAKAGWTFQSIMITKCWWQFSVNVDIISRHLSDVNYISMFSTKVLQQLNIPACKDTAEVFAMRCNAKNDLMSELLSMSDKLWYWFTSNTF